MGLHVLWADRMGKAGLGTTDLLGEGKRKSLIGGSELNLLLREASVPGIGCCEILCTCVESWLRGAF